MESISHRTGFILLRLVETIHARYEQSVNMLMRKLNNILRSSQIWDLRRRQPVYTIPAHTNLISDVKYQKDGGNFLVTSSYDCSVKVKPIQLLFFLLFIFYKNIYNNFSLFKWN